MRYDSPTLDIFDRLLRSALNGIANADISDTQWLQASPPIKDGGHTFRSSPPSKAPITPDEDHEDRTAS